MVVFLILREADQWFNIFSPKDNCIGSMSSSIAPKRFSGIIIWSHYGGNKKCCEHSEVIFMRMEQPAMTNIVYNWVGR